MVVQKEEEEVNIDVDMENHSDSNISRIDWLRVGKLYRPDSAVESIISNEVDRLRKSLAMSMDI